MNRAPLLASIVALCLLATAACGPGIDLGKALELTETLTGYYDNGLKDGKSHMVPSLTFRLHNKGDKAIGPVQLSISFWPVGADGEKDSVLVQGVGSSGLAPGASTEVLLARSTVGFTVEGARADMFNNAFYVDWVAKVFASQAGNIYRLGEFKIDRRIIPHVQ